MGGKNITGSKQFLFQESLSKFLACLSNIDFLPTPFHVTISSVTWLSVGGTGIQEKRPEHFHIIKETFRFRHRFGIKNTPSCFMTSRTRPSEASDTRIPPAGRPIVTQDPQYQEPPSSPQDEAPAGPHPPRFREPHWPVFRPPFLLVPGICHGRRAPPIPALIGQIFTTARRSASLYWFLGLRMGGERQSDGAQGGKGGVRRRVVGDARPRILLGNRLLSPRPLGAFCPVNCRSGGGSSARRHAGAVQGEAVVSGSEGCWGESWWGGCGAPGPRWLSARRSWAPQSLSAPEPASHDPGGCLSPPPSSLSAHTHFQVAVWKR